MPYNNDNIFARILRGELPCERLYEDEHVLAFRDINPQAPIHVLVIPKGAYTDLDHFMTKASEDEITALMRAVSRLAVELGIGQSGYRILINCGDDAHQEVPHLHIHLLGGRRLGPMLTQP